ncbi:phage tail protein [Limobrevibacterium gyesilva]|uniref:Phage tail protein n=1 Tax=Limobrevibacterium gyesilva TaxID=2991712 RepID=A0AA42CEH4_9PROT|nr:phage tail protein [Limobrevibacterium gyesilva]MCW3476058.1 phage tail protein [Limobrevibacterium gyesilva]
MVQFSVNTTRIDPYKNFKFRVVVDGQPVAGVSKVSGLKRTTEVVTHRDGGDLSTKRHSPGVTSFEPVTLERGITYDLTFESWATLVYSVEGDAGVSLKNFRKDIAIELYNLQGVKVKAWKVYRCWVSEFTAVPELDANGNAIAFESIIIQNEGFERDIAVVEVAET